VNLGRLLESLGQDSVDVYDLELLATTTNPAVKAEISRQLDILATAIGAFINIFNPESVVLGGFLAALHEADPDRLRSGVAEASIARLGNKVRIDRAQLRSRLLMIGTAELAFAGLLADPAAWRQPLLPEPS